MERFVMLAAAAALATAAPLPAQQVLDVIPGQAAGDGLGVSVVATGDLDGDGKPDLATGSPYAYSGAVDAGAVQAWSSADGSLLFRKDGQVSGELFGSSLAVAGDVDGDGLDDLVAGGQGGFVRLLSGADGSVLRTWSGAADSFGFAVAGPGDLDGDGTPDVVIASPYGSDRDVRAYSGATGALLHTWSGGSSGFGSRLAAAGDLDGDGRGDVLVLEAQTGAVHAFSGAMGALLFTLPAPPDALAFGQGLTGGRDVDLDGVPDVLVGDPLFGGFTVGFGRVHLFSGASGAELWSFVGPAPLTDLGGALAFVGDVDLDGRPDVAAGQAGVAVGSQSGGPYVLSGAGGSLIGHVKDHVLAGSTLGEALAGIGDLDGDGRGELMAAAPGAHNGRGEVRVYSFACEPVATYCSAKPSAQGCQPRMDWGGVPGASAGAPFELRGLSLPAGTAATLFYSLAGSAAAPFQGGTLCVQPPTARTPAQATGGVPGTCGGDIAFDFNAWIAAGADPALVPGAQVWGQVWGRDPGDPFGSTLTDAIVFRVCP